MLTGKTSGQRLVALFALGLLLFNGPLLRLWLGPLALFALWAALIGALAWLLERGGEG